MIDMYINISNKINSAPLDLVNLGLQTCEIHNLIFSISCLLTIAYIY